MNEQLEPLCSEQVQSASLTGIPQRGLPVGWCNVYIVFLQKDSFRISLIE